jgi:enolase
MPERPGRRAIHSLERLGVTCAANAKKGARGGNMVAPALNQLLRIEEELGDEAVHPGWSAFPRVGR